tara:strand:- start:11704 stop:12840 length:1137 start_codon:yes stop_codon:yes gene_type:complete
MNNKHLNLNSFSNSEIGQRRGLFARMHLDIPLLLAIIITVIFGLIILYSASGNNIQIIERQLIRIGVAFFVMVMVAQISPTTLCRWSPWLYCIGILLLLTVLFFGDFSKGAKRWLNVGVFSFQPSEMMKLAVPFMIAWYFSEKKLPPDYKNLFTALILISIPTILIIKQPDLGTAVLIAFGGIFILFLAGLQLRVILISGALFAAISPFIWSMLYDYQKRRVLTFFDPENDPLGAGYHIIQSKIAIGSGGIYGKGWLNGTQSQLDFLPERHTDFIFAVLSEEFGMIGIIILLFLYLFILFRGFYIANQAQSTFGRLLAGTLTLVFFVYVFVNMGMVTGLLPVVGIPLPLISYGGTALVTLMASFGILMSIHTNKKLIS